MNLKLYITFASLSLGILLAPLISNLLKLPTSITEILLGIIIGNIGLEKYLDYTLISPFSYFGFLLLMFLAGLEIKIRELKNLKIWQILFILIPIIFNFILSILAVIFFNLSKFFILIFSLISAGIVISILKELNLFKTEYGKILFFIGVVGEAFSLFLLTLFSLIYKFKYPLLFVKETILLIVVSFFAYITLKIIYLIVWWFPAKFLIIFTRDSRESGVRLSIGILLVLSSLFGIAHIEPILGAFITGLIFANVTKKEEILEEKFSGLSYGFFIPIFFMNIGIKFSFPEISLFSFLKLFAIFLGIKFFAFLPLGIKYNLRLSLGAALLMAAPLTLLIAVAEFGKNLGVLKENEVLSLILLAIISGIICPSLFKILVKPDKVLKES